MGKLCDHEILPLKEYTAKEVKAIRNNLGYTQREFAKLLGLSSKTIEAWEYGFKKPAGGSQRLLQLFENNAPIMQKVLIIKND